VALRKAGERILDLVCATSSQLDGAAGVRMSPSTLSDFMTSLTASPHSHSISFQEFRDFLLLLPRRVSTKEIYRFYELRKFLGDDGRGAARVTMEGTLSHISHGVDTYSLGFTPVPYAGDVSLSAEDKPPNYLIYRPPIVQLPSVPPMHRDATPNDADDGDDDDDDLLQDHHHIEDEHHNWLGGTTAVKFLAAGGVAGAGQRFLLHVSITTRLVKCALDCEQCRGHPQLRLTV